MPYMTGWMSSKLGQTIPLCFMATDRVLMAIMMSPLFLACSSSNPLQFSYLHVIMICMDTCSSLKFGYIRPPTVELAGFKCLKNPHRLICQKKKVLSPETLPT